MLRNADNLEVVAVMVAYHPDIITFTKAIKSIVHQVSKLYIIDNSAIHNEIPNGFLQEFEYASKIELILLGKNLGIAKAQNLGIQKAIEDNASYILLSDQDSEFPPNYIEQMVFYWDKIIDKDKVAAMAPDFEELNRGGARQGFEIFESVFRKKIYPKTGCHRVTQVISSGKIISAKALKEIGLMDEALFIDWVDLEWCWRARKRGFYIIGCADVVIKHSIGDSIQPFLKKSYTIHTPIRHYYIIRNAVHLALRSPNLFFGMRINLFEKALLHIISFSILGKPHLKHLSYSLRGFCHGIAGRLGAY